MVLGRRDIAERNEHESALVQPGVGNGQVRLSDPLISIEQQIEIQGARRPLLGAAAIATARALDGEHPLEQRASRQTCSHAQHSVQVRPLTRRTDGRGLIDARASDELQAGRLRQSVPRGFQVSLARAQVRTQRDRGHHGPGRQSLVTHVNPRCSRAGGFYSYNRAVSENNPVLPPELKGEIPGPRSRALAERLAAVESRNVTCLAPSPPIFWQRAQGANVWDADGNRYIDLTAAFGVAGAGHAHPEIVTAIAHQAGELLHGMGDVHPAEVKVELLEALVRRYPGGQRARGILLSSGSDAVEAALKTAALASGLAGVLAFEGAYHGLSLGALDATWRRDFREPFERRLPGATRFARFGDIQSVKRVAQESGEEIGAVLVEPVQGRAGDVLPPRGFLAALRSFCDEQGWLLIADEIYTGFGRTGRWFACEHEDVVPALLCVGKALSGGMPISACLGLEHVMDAWPASKGEALHTQTFLAHPASCAAALASIRTIDDERLVDRAADSGATALAQLRERLSDNELVTDVRGLGLMIGIECISGKAAAKACDAALRSGVILLPSGENGRVLSITPPLSIDRDGLQLALELVCQALS